MAVRQCQELGKKDEERREAVWARLHEEAENRCTEDLQVRAQRYLSSAARFETEGNFKAAAAYYRLILRSLPETPAASEAKAALEQGLRQFSATLADTRRPCRWSRLNTRFLEKSCGEVLARLDKLDFVDQHHICSPADEGSKHT